MMLLTLLSVILMAIGGVVGGRSGAFTMLLISFAMNFYTYWNCDKMALRAYNAQPLSESDVPELYQLVRELTAKAHMPMPRLYVIPTDVPNAFATGRNENHAAVAVTEGILSMLDRDELAGVLSHELSHIRHRDTLIMTLAASIATAISYIANIAQWAAIFGGARDEEGRSANPIALLVTIVLPAEYGYDPKQLHHLLRVQEYIHRYISGESYEACLHPKRPEFLVAVKQGYFNLEQARTSADAAIADVIETADAFCEKVGKTFDTAVDELLDDVQYNIVKSALKGEILSD